MDDKDAIEKASDLERANGADADAMEDSDMTTGSTASPFLNLPFDLLAEILILTEPPGDILAVARTSKQLYSLLVSPAAGFIWKKARIAVGLPDPAMYTAQIETAPSSDELPETVVGVAYFMGREPAYAALVFDRGICEVRIWFGCPFFS